MRGSRVLVGSLLGAFVLVCGAPRNMRAQAKKPMDSRAEIETLETSYNNAFNTRDITGIMSCYARGRALFVFDVVPPRQYASWDAYKRDWETLLSQYPGPVSNQISEQSITVLGTVAYGHNIQSTTLTNKDGSKLHVVVRVTDVYRKFGTKWLIVQEHVSVPVNLATGQADLLSQP